MNGSVREKTSPSKENRCKFIEKGHRETLIGRLSSLRG